MLWACPFSFFGAFLFFDAFGVNFHVITLLALIIVLGIVVDDAVVVGENIIAEQERGEQGLAAAIKGIQGVAAPVTVGVLTTIAAFAPLAFVSGFFSQFYQAVPIVVVTVLLMSLLEVFLILPAHLTHGHHWSAWPLNKIQKTLSKALMAFRDRHLMPAIARSIKYKKNDYFSVRVILLLRYGAGGFQTSALRVSAKYRVPPASQPAWHFP